MNNEFTRPIARPEWLEDSIASTRNTLRLAAKGILPKSITGWGINRAKIAAELRAAYQRENSADSTWQCPRCGSEVKYRLAPDNCPDCSETIPPDIAANLARD